MNRDPSVNILIPESNTDFANNNTNNSNESNCSDSLVHDLSQIPSQFHESFVDKWNKYHDSRKKIFDENSSVEIDSVPSNRIEKVRNRHHDLKKEYKLLNKTTISVEEIGSDPRPFVKVQLFGETITALMDSGASISVLGRDSIELLENHNIKFKKLSSQVKTASGSSVPILGKLNTNIIWKGQEKLITLYVAPDLTQNLYLGYDFFKLYGLDRFLVSELNVDDEIDDPKMHDLKPEQRSRLNRVIDMFPSSLKLGLGKTHLLEHNINTGDSHPIKRKHYPISPAKEQLIYAELDRMLSLGVIEESQSPWSAPVTAKITPGKTRLCIDCRDLNEVTIKDAYPVPNIDGLLMRLTGTTFISALDLKDAFWQIPLEKNSREKTAFIVAGRPLYQFSVMPFGLCNAPATMSRLMDKVIDTELKHRVFVYLDDLLIFSDNFEDHLVLLEKVAKCILKSGLTLNLAKSKFGMKEVNYLGHIVGNGVVRTNDEKVLAISKYALPRTPKEVRCFLGMSGFYRKFILNYADLAAPLNDLCRKGIKFVMTDVAKDAFENIKIALCSAPVLVHPDYNKPFVIQCDASKLGIGAVLCQVDDNGDERPLFFFSKKMNKAQRNYSVTEQECLAVVLAVKKFRPYVELHNFKVVTDHNSLKWLMKTKDLSGRLARWSFKLGCYNFEIEHRKGSENIVPDALSRGFEENVSSLEICAVEVDLNSPEFEESDYCALRNNCLEFSDSLPDVKVVQNLVFHRTQFRKNSFNEENCWKLWLPNSLTSKVIEDAHNPPEASHGGISKTLARIREKYFWPNMACQVRSFVTNCNVCKCSKSPNDICSPPMGKSFTSSRPFQKLYMDFTGPYVTSKSGNTVVFVVLDHFSKFVFLQPFPRATGANAIQFLEKSVFPLFGVPEFVHTDNGTQFVGRSFEAFLVKYGIKHHYNPLYSPQCNASERLNRTLIESIRAYVKSDHCNWDQQLTSIGISMRSSIHSSIGMTPFCAVFGTNMVTHASAYPILRKLDCLNDSEEVLTKQDQRSLMNDKISQQLQSAHNRAEKIYNKHTRKINYLPGQIVYRRNYQISNLGKNFSSKLAPKYVKTKVHAVVGNNLYQLIDEDGQIKGIFHAKDLRL